MYHKAVSPQDRYSLAHFTHSITVSALTWSKTLFKQVSASKERGARGRDSEVLCAQYNSVDR